MLEFLKTLGISEEQQSQILAEYNKEINLVQGEKNSLTAQLKEKEEAFNTTLESYKDYDEIKSELGKVQTEYTGFKEKFDEVEKSHVTKLNDTIIQKEIEKSLIKNNVKYADLLLQKFDKSALKIKDGVVSGLDQQVEHLKANYADFFTQGTNLVGQAPPQRTESPQFLDVANMTAEEVAKNWDKIRTEQRRI